MALTADSLAAILVLTAAIGAGNAIAQPAEFALVPVASGPDRVERGQRAGRDRPVRGRDRRPARGRPARRGRAARGRPAARRRHVRRRRARRPAHARPPPPARRREGRRRPRPRARRPRVPDRRPRPARDARRRVAALLFFSMSIAAEVFYVTDVLKAGDAAYGVLMASWTLGMVAGAVGLARRIPPAALAAGALAGVAVQGARPRRRGRLRRAVGRARRLHARRHRARRQERPAAHADPRARAGRPARPRVRRLQRGAQRRRAGCARRRRRSIGAIGAQPALLLSGAIPLAIGVTALIVLAWPSVTAQDRTRLPGRLTSLHEVPHVERDRADASEVDRGGVDDMERPGRRRPARRGNGSSGSVGRQLPVKGALGAPRRTAADAASSNTDLAEVVAARAVAVEQPSPSPPSGRGQRADEVADERVVETDRRSPPPPPCTSCRRSRTSARPRSRRPSTGIVDRGARGAVVGDRHRRSGVGERRQRRRAAPRSGRRATPWSARATPANVTRTASRKRLPSG